MSSPPDNRSSGEFERPLDAKDARRLQSWLAELDAEVANYAQAPFAERLRLSMRLLRQGQTKRQRKILEQFRKWSAEKSRSDASSRKEATSAVEAREADREAAAQSTEGETLAPLAETDLSALSQVHVYLYDLAGPDAVEATLANREIPWDAFAGVELISPWPPSAVPDLPTPFCHTAVDGEPFDLFKILDERTRQASSSDAPLTLFLETGAWPLRMLARLVSDDGPSPTSPVRFLRTLPSNGDAPSPLLDRASAERSPLVPQAFPALLLDQKAAGDQVHFERFLHYAGWDLLLTCLEEAAETGPPHGESPPFLPATPAVGFWPHHHNLLDYRRRCYKQRRDEESLRRLLPPLEEWQVLRHDLIVQIVSAHPEFFRDRAAYLAAIAAATVAT